MFDVEFITIVKGFLLFVLGVFLLYLASRVISAGAAKSWFDIKEQKTNGGNEDEKKSTKR